MPELPDITIYLEALERRVLRQPLNQVRIASPFLLRTVIPPIRAVQGREVIESVYPLRLNTPAGHTMELWEMLDIAARRGVLLRPQIPLPGTRKRLLRTRMRTRFAGAHCITFGSTPISRRNLPMPRWDSSKQVRQ